MNILVINGHKYYPFAKGRLNKTLFDRITELLSVSHQVDTTVVESGYNLDEEIEKFKKSHIIIFQTPVYWFSFPYILKEYIDNVYRYGVFYSSSEEYGRGGLMCGKKYMYSLTCNAPYEAFSEFGGFMDGRGIENAIIAMHKLQEYCGLKKIPTFSCHDVVKNPDVTLFLKNLELHLKKYIPE